MKKAPFTLATLILTVALATTVANAQAFTDLFDFNGTDGALPESPNLLAQGRDGNLYGTTLQGGVYGSGVVFVIKPNGIQRVLFSFDYHTGGFLPESGLTLGTDGDFYGTTSEDNVFFQGNVFKITPSGSLTTLYTFTGGTDSGFPHAPPIEGTHGTFYGTTAYGYNPSIYEITPSGAFTVLGQLPGDSLGSLIEGSDGNFYGTTTSGGSGSNCPGGCGTVFKATPKGIVTTLNNFYGQNGAKPWGGVTQGSDGNLYGTATAGGTNKRGVIFKLSPKGITILHNFPDPNYGKDGEQPYALIQATDGNFYGIAPRGGTSDFGVIFEITPSGVYSILHNFDGTHGGYASSTLVQHTNGKIYGLTNAGGHSNDGVVYSLDLGLPPFVRLVSPSGKVGQTGGILGQGFTGATNVFLNGTSAAFTIMSDTYLTATVPPGATTGFVTVVTPSGTLTSNQEFQVRP